MKLFISSVLTGLLLSSALFAQNGLPPTAPAGALTPTELPTPAAEETPASSVAWPDTPAPDENRLFTATSQYYQVQSAISQAHADETVLIMESLLAKYNSYLLLDLKNLTTPFKVLWLADKASFDTYLKDKLSQPRNDFVYLSYKDPAKSVLVAYEGTEHPLPSLAFQGFVQYLWNFVPQAPVWVRNGFGYYFWDHQWNAENRSLEPTGSLAYLDQAKSAVNTDGVTLDALLNLTDATLGNMSSSTADPLAWSLVYFLINSNNPVYNRILGNVMGALSETSPQEENTAQVLKRMTNAVTLTSLDQDLRTYLGTLEGFSGTMKAGIAAYRQFADAKKAEDPKAFEAQRTAVQFFDRAKAQKPRDYRPLYYLGLTAYTDGDFATAESYFRDSQALGAARDGLLPYALGLALYYQKKTDEAVTLLNQAKAQNPGEFGANVDSLLAMMEEE